MHPSVVWRCYLGDMNGIQPGVSTATTVLLAHHDSYGGNMHAVLSQEHCELAHATVVPKTLLCGIGLT